MKKLLKDIDDADMMQIPNIRDVVEVYEGRGGRREAGAAAAVTTEATTAPVLEARGRYRNEDMGRMLDNGEAAFFTALEEGKDHAAAYAEQVKKLRRKDVKSFRARLEQKAAEKGIALSLDAPAAATEAAVTAATDAATEGGEEADLSAERIDNGRKALNKFIKEFQAAYPGKMSDTAAAEYKRRIEGIKKLSEYKALSKELGDLLPKERPMNPEQIKLFKKYFGDYAIAMKRSFPDADSDKLSAFVTRMESVTTFEQLYALERDMYAYENQLSAARGAVRGSSGTEASAARGTAQAERLAQQPRTPIDPLRMGAFEDTGMGGVIHRNTVINVEMPSVNRAPTGTGRIIEVPIKASWEIDKKRYRGIRAKKLEEIRMDPREEQLYGELLEGLRPDGKEMLAKAIAREPISFEDERFLEYGRYELARRLKEVDPALEAFQASDIEILGRRHEAIRIANGQRTPEETLKAFKNLILHESMKSQRFADDFSKAMTAVRDNRDTPKYRAWDRKVQQWCKDNNIDPADYPDMMHFEKGARADTRKELYEHIAKDMNGFQRALGIASLKTRRAFKQAERLDRQTKRIWGTAFLRPTAETNANIDENLDVIKKLLSKSITDKNPDFITNLRYTAATGETVRRTSEIPVTVEASNVQKEAFTVPKIKQRMEAHLQAARTAAGGTLTPAQESASLADFRSSEMAQRPQGKGFIARCLSAFMEMMFGRAEQEVMRRPAAATA